MTRKLLDYEDRLLDHLDGLGLPYPVVTDTNTADASISLVSSPGSKTVRTYYDGAMDKEYSHFIQLKASLLDGNGPRQTAYNTLLAIGADLESLIDLPSQNGSYDFGRIVVSNEPYFLDASEEGYLLFRLSINTALTTY